MSGSKEDPPRKNRPSNHSDTDMANSALVCTTYKNVCTDTISSASIATFLTNPQGKNYPLVETGSLRLAVQNVSGKVCKWREFQAMLPNFSHSRRNSSTTNYESAWGQWTSWCNDRQVNSFQAPENYIINFLSEKFDKKS